MKPEDVFGTWALISNTVEDMEGKIHNPLGPNPKGFLMLTPDGRFTAILTASDRKAGDTTEAAAALQRSMTAYTGRYTTEPNLKDPDGLTVRNKVDIAWNESWVGSEQVRHLSLKGDVLTITAHPEIAPQGGKIRQATIIWKRSR
jgi:hypothetical protein